MSFKPLAGPEVCPSHLLKCVVHTSAGLLWKWDLSRTLGWARPPAMLRISRGGEAPDGPRSSDLYRNYAAPSGSWHAGSDALSDCSAWGGLAKYEDWPVPLGCFPCEGGMPAVHLAGAWDPVGLLLLASDGEEGEEGLQRAVVAQLRM